MPASDHSSLIAFDAAVHTAFHAAGDLGPLVRHDTDRYAALAAMIAAVTEGSPDTLGERLDADFRLLAGEEAPAPHERPAKEPEGRADLERATQALGHALAGRGLQAADADRIAGAILLAAEGLVRSVGPETGAGPEPAEQRDATYGLP